MLRHITPFVCLLFLASCAENGDFKNPFVKDRPFSPSAVPGDFAIVVDESHDTFTTRQHVQQVLTAADAISRTTYTNFQDFNDAVRERYTTETAMTPAQLQDLWNQVTKNNLMQGSTIWINWRSDADLYKKNAYTIQIRADGRTRTFRQINGFSGALRNLMLLAEGVRLPSARNTATPVVGGAPAAAPAATLPATAPAQP